MCEECQNGGQSGRELEMDASQPYWADRGQYTAPGTSETAYIVQNVSQCLKFFVSLGSHPGLDHGQSSLAHASYRMMFVLMCSFASRIKLST